MTKSELHRNRRDTVSFVAAVSDRRTLLPSGCIARWRTARV